MRQMIDLASDDNNNNNNNNSSSSSNATEPTGASSVLSFDQSEREGLRLARVQAELDDVVRAARLATAFPRTVDKECFDDCPEADREATQLRELVERLADMAPESPDWVANELPRLYVCVCVCVCV